MVACGRGHLDDFPWHRYLHSDVACDSELELVDTGTTGSITDLWVKCPRHNARKNLGQAFGRSGGRQLPGCSAARPWLGDTDPAGCDERPRVLLRGASNAYFPLVESAISIPPWSDPIQIALGQYADLMAKVDSPEKLENWLELSNAPELGQFSIEQVWEALKRRREGTEELDGAPDLREEEWRAFQVEPGTIDAKAEFRSSSVSVPDHLQEWVDRVVLLERLREVRALRGFTRIDPVPDIGTLEEVEAVKAGMSRITAENPVNWYPGIDYRGEGIFMQLREDLVKEWETSPEVRDLEKEHVAAQQAWYKARQLELSSPRTARYLLLHSMSHLLIRQLGLECGYASASLRERIYSSNEAGKEMAGILIYTATPDSEGSLGGLVEMGRPEDLGRLMMRAFEDASMCASDPYCAGRGPDMPNNDLNGAACHTCLLISETACEAGNRYLNRGVVVPTVRGDATAFIRS
jgi:hypothetical protein